MVVQKRVLVILHDILELHAFQAGEGLAVGDASEQIVLVGIGVENLVAEVEQLGVFGLAACKTGICRVELRFEGGIFACSRACGARRRRIGGLGIGQRGISRRQLLLQRCLCRPADFATARARLRWSPRPAPGRPADWRPDPPALRFARLSFAARRAIALPWSHRRRRRAGRCRPGRSRARPALQTSAVSLKTSRSGRIGRRPPYRSVR